MGGADGREDGLEEEGRDLRGAQLFPGQGCFAAGGYQQANVVREVVDGEGVYTIVSTYRE